RTPARFHRVHEPTDPGRSSPIGRCAVASQTCCKRPRRPFEDRSISAASWLETTRAVVRSADRADSGTYPSRGNTPQCDPEATHEPDESSYGRKRGSTRNLLHGCAQAWDSLQVDSRGDPRFALP